MAKDATTKILEHPDRDEIISKLLLGISAKDISSNLSIRYGDVDKKLILSESTISSFKKNSLNIYKTIQEDLHKTSVALATGTEANLTIKSNPQYKEAMLKLANNELDVKTMLGNLILSVENRVAQLTDLIQQDPENINSKNERLLNEYIDRLQGALEKWHKYILQVPDHVSQVNVSVQHIDTQMAVLHEVIRRVLSHMDYETSLLFWDLLKEEMDKVKSSELRQKDVEERLTEVKILNDQINDKLNK